jgi:hypothetical protein
MKVLSGGWRFEFAACLYGNVNMRKASTVITCLSFGCLLLSSSCYRVKGYPGPELPDEQIATVTYSRDSAEVDVDTAMLDGIEFYRAGITVLPGTHHFNLRLVLKDPPFDCQTYSSLDYSGYDRCRDDRERDGSSASSCDCYEYLSVYKKCLREVYDASCEGEVKTRAGAKFQIDVQKDNKGARVSIHPEGGLEKTGNASCTTTNQRIDSDTDFRGTGRSTAYSNGIYNCD